MIICFNGIDGSGKSLQAKRLVDQLNSDGYPAVHLWLGGKRPIRRYLIRSVKRVMQLPYISKTRRNQAANGNDRSVYRSYLESLHPFFKHRIVRSAWLHASLMEHAVEIWLRVMPHLRQGRIVVCDRYLHDSIVRLAILSRMEVEQFAPLLKLLQFYRVPVPAMQFLVDVPASVAYERKDDIPDHRFLQMRIPLYHCLAERTGMVVLDGARSPDAIANDIWQAVQPLLNGHLDARPTDRAGSPEIIELEE